jgi:predicted nucleic acid-binding protein
MIYIDTSCLVKVFLFEESTQAVLRAIGNEKSVVVSGLTELETLIELKAGHMGGNYGIEKWRHLELQLHVLRNEEPFVFRPMPNGIWEVAFRQHRTSRDVHCRTLDRLHLAAAEKFGITRIMTRDAAQSKAAEELGFEVVEPL